MQVRCISTTLTHEQLRQLKMSPRSPDYQLLVGGIYLVLGLTFMLPEDPQGGGAHYQVLNDFGDIRSVPACLFVIEDARCSKHWVARADDDGAMLLWPEEFFTKYFHDDLSEGVPATKTMFEIVVKKMKAEAEERPRIGLG